MYCITYYTLYIIHYITHINPRTRNIFNYHETQKKKKEKEKGKIQTSQNIARAAQKNEKINKIK